MGCVGLEVGLEGAEVDGVTDGAGHCGLICGVELGRDMMLGRFWCFVDTCVESSCAEMELWEVPRLRLNNYRGMEQDLHRDLNGGEGETVKHGEHMGPRYLSVVRVGEKRSKLFVVRCQ